MLAVAVALTALGFFSLELAALLSVLGFLCLAALTAPASVTPAWRSRLRWLVAAGLLLVVGLAAVRLLELLQSGVL